MARWQDVHRPCRARTLLLFFSGTLLGLVAPTLRLLGVASRADRSERPSAPLPRTCPRRTSYSSRRRRRSSACRSDRRTVCPDLASHRQRATDESTRRTTHVSTETMMPQKKKLQVGVCFARGVGLRVASESTDAKRRPKFASLTGHPYPNANLNPNPKNASTRPKQTAS